MNEYLIYGTQIELLEFLSLQIEPILILNEPEGFYSKHMKLSSKPITLVQFFKFLVDNELVIIEGDFEKSLQNSIESTMLITQLGIDFLNYIKHNYRIFYKAKQF